MTTTTIKLTKFKLIDKYLENEAFLFRIKKITSQINKPIETKTEKNRSSIAN
jgi:hypothetical protein